VLAFCPDHLFWLHILTSCSDVPVLALLFLLPSFLPPALAAMFWLSYSGCPVLAVLLWLSFSCYFVLGVLSDHPDLAVLFLLICLSSAYYIILAVLSRLSCSGCPVPVILTWLSCP
jgi:hypothetical protein